MRARVRFYGVRVRAGVSVRVRVRRRLRHLVDAHAQRARA